MLIIDTNLLRVIAKHDCHGHLPSYGASQLGKPQKSGWVGWAGVISGALRRLRCQSSAPGIGENDDPIVVRSHLHPS